MSFVVARMQKMKSGNLVGVGNHNQRNTDNHSNKDIDVERSYLNYDLVNRTENYKRDIEQFINDNRCKELKGQGLTTRKSDIICSKCDLLCLLQIL